VFLCPQGLEDDLDWVETCRPWEFNNTNKSKLYLTVSNFLTCKQKKIIFREEYVRIIQEWGRESVEKNLHSSFHGGGENLSRKLENLAENDLTFK
jgi:hypothetical protein